MNNTNAIKKKTREKKTFNDYWGRYSTAAILFLMCVIFGSLEPKAFLNGDNLIKIIEQSSITILLACGEFFAILLAGIDLSVSSTMALTGVMSASLISSGVNPVVAILVGAIFFGALLGAVNGALINLTNLPPFIITLGTQAIYRGLTMIISGAQAIPGLTSIKILGGKIFGIIPTPIIVALVVAGILVFFTMKTKAGRNLYAIGGNAQSAWYSGIHVKRHTLLAFIIAGVCAGFAGMVNIARLGAAEPNAGTGYETYAIASVIIGGTSFFGGQGVIPKVVIGGLIIGVINNGLNMLGLSSFYQQIAMGALIIIAVTLDRFFGTNKKA